MNPTQISATEQDITASITETVCKSFGNISYSRKDTVETRAEIVQHNAAYNSFGCEAK